MCDRFAQCLNKSEWFPPIHPNFGTWSRVAELSAALYFFIRKECLHCSCNKTCLGKYKIIDLIFNFSCTKQRRQKEFGNLVLSKAFRRILVVLRVEAIWISRLASLPEKGNGNIEYFISSSGNAQPVEFTVVHSI